MAFNTKKLALGLCAGLLVSGSALAQSAAEQAQSITLPFSRTVAEAGDDAGQFFTPIQPGVRAMDIDSSIYYEDFRDGLEGWTFIRENPDSVLLWEYLTNPDLAVRVGQTRYPVYTSPTADNGFMWFEYIEFASIGGNPGPPYKNLTQSAISPMIDLSSTVAGTNYTLNWFNYDPRLNIRNTRVEMRFMDDEDSAVEIWRVPDALERPATTARGRDVFARIPAQFIGQDSVQILFIYDGDFYGWAIDDIFVGGLPSNEVSLDNTFFSVAPNYRTPQSQVAGQNIYFITDVDNNGGEAQAPKVIVSIFKLVDGGGELYYTDSLQYPTIEPEDVFDNNVFPRWAPLPTEPGQYRTFYEVVARDAADPDADPANNVASYDFFISAEDSLVSYDKAPLFRSATRPSNTNSPLDYEVGNIYLTPNLGTQGMRIDKIVAGYYLTGTQDTPEDSFFELRTYGFKGDLDGDRTPVIDDGTGVDGAELVLLGTRFFTVEAGTASDFYDLVALPGEDQDGNPTEVIIPANEGYVGYAIGMSWVAPSAPGAEADNFWVGVDNNYENGTAGFAQDLLDTANIKDRGILEFSQYTNFRGNTTGALGYDDFSTSSLFMNTIVTFLDSVGAVGVNEELLVNEFEVSPNPATTEFNVSFDFGTTTSDITFKLVNGIGQQVMQINRPGSATGRLTIPVAELNQGVYFLTATDENGASSTRRVLIQR